MRQRFLWFLCLCTLVYLCAQLAPFVKPAAPDGLPELSASLARVEAVEQRQRVLGYEREAFGSGWAAAPRSACTTREVAILEQTSQLRRSGACDISRGSLHDPYADTEVPLRRGDTPVEVDHVFPLSAAWDLGAHTWSAQRRQEFANDPLNLVVTRDEVNRDKSDDLPARWLPPAAGQRCWYVRRVAAVAATYGLPLPRRDLQVMRAQCRLTI